MNFLKDTPAVDTRGNKPRSNVSFVTKIKMISNRFLDCSKCNGTSKVRGIGHIEHDCPSKVCKAKKWLLRQISKLLSWLMSNPLKTTPIIVAFFFCCAIVSYDLLTEGYVSPETLIASFISIFTALKYKLDQATYHKSLFNKRYKVYTGLLSVLTHYAQELKVSKEMFLKVNNIDLFMKGRFLFGKETRAFIKKFQSSIGIIYHGLESDGEVKDQMGLKVEEARNFLNPLIDGYNFAEKFKELDISGY